METTVATPVVGYAVRVTWPSRAFAEITEWARRGDDPDACVWGPKCDRTVYLVKSEAFALYYQTKFVLESLESATGHVAPFVEIVRVVRTTRAAGG
jgi:hypothetical protein